MIRPSNVRLLAALVIAWLLAPTQALAQTTYTWNTGTGNWNVPGNWLGGIAPTGGNITDTLVFGGTGSYTATNNFGFPFYLGDIQTTASANVTLNATGTFPNSQPLRMFGFLGPQIVHNSTGTLTFQNIINILEGESVTAVLNSGTGTATFGLSTSDDGSFIVGNGNFTIINNSTTTAQVGNLQEHFQGTLTLAGGNFIAARTAGNLFGERVIINVAAGASFNFNNNGENMGVVVGGGSVTRGTAALDFRTAGNHSFSGTITGTTGTITFRHGRAGEGSYTLSGSVTSSTGAWAIQVGTLHLVDNGTLNATGSNSLTITNGATIRLDNTGSGNLADRITDTTTIGLAGTLELLGANLAASSETVGAVTIGTTGASRIIAAPGTGGTATLTLASLARGGRGSVVDFSTTGQIDITTPPTLVNGIIGGYATMGSDWATITGTTVTPLATYQTDTDPTNWLATDNVLVNAALAGVVGTRTINSLNIQASAGTIDIGVGNTLTLATNGLLASTNATIDNGTILGGTATNPEVTVTVTGTNTLTINSVIGDTGTQSLSKAGTGTLVLNGANTYSAGTGIGGGTLVVSNVGNLGSNVATNVVAVSNGTLVIDGDFTTNARDLVFAGGNNVIVVTGSNIALFNTISDNQDSGGFVKTGTGTLVGNAGGLNGPITILQGTFRASGGGLGTAGDAIDNQTILTIAAGAIFDDSFGNGEDFGTLAGAGDVHMNAVTGGLQFFNDPSNPFNTTFSGRIRSYASGLPSTGTQSVRFGNTTAVTGSGGTITLTGLSDYVGQTIINYGKVRIGADVLPGLDGPLGNPTSTALRTILLGSTVNNSRTNGALLIASPGVTIGRDITVRDSTTPGQAFGIVTLGSDHTSGPSTYSGNIAINRSLELTVAGSATTTFSGNLSGTGRVTKVGSGTAVFSGTGSTMSGPIYIAQGRLNVANTSGSATGTSNVFVSNTATFGGEGSITGNVTIYGGGIIAPGISSGDPTLDTGNVTFGPPSGVAVSVLSLTLYDTGPTDISLLNVTGNVTVHPTSRISLDLGPVDATTLRSIVFPGTRTYTVVQGTGTVDNFNTANLDLVNLGSFLASEWEILASPAPGTVQLLFTPIPEPTSILGLAAVAVAGIWTRRRLKCVRA